MINTDKIVKEDMDDMQNIIQKEAEKSPLLEQRYFLSEEPIDKAKIFIYCRRLLYNIYNQTKSDTELRKELEKELFLTVKIYNEISYLLMKFENSSFNKRLKLEKIKRMVTELKEINDLIDFMGIMLEKTTMMSRSRMKGVLIEGPSANEFKRIMGIDNKNNSISKEDESNDETEEEQAEYSELPEGSGEAEQQGLEKPSESDTQQP